MKGTVECLALSLLLVSKLAAADDRVKWCGTGSDSCDQPGKGYTMCEHLKRVLDSLPADETLPICEFTTSSQLGKFELPGWQPLSVAENLPVIYDMEMFLVMPNGGDPYYTKWRHKFRDDYWSTRNFDDPATWRAVPYEEWLPDFRARMQAGTIDPKLAYATVTLNERGPQKLYRYERTPRGNAQRCAEDVATARYGQIGAYIFSAVDSPAAPALPIIGATGDVELRTYEGKAVFVKGSGPRFYWVDLLISYPQSQRLGSSYAVHQRCGLRGIDNP